LLGDFWWIGAIEVLRDREGSGGRGIDSGSRIALKSGVKDVWSDLKNFENLENCGLPDVRLMFPHGEWASLDAKGSLDKNAETREGARGFPGAGSA